MSKSNQTGLSERQLKTLPFFVTSCSDVDACRKANISKQTYYEWLKNPHFKAELKHLRDLVIEDAVEQLKAYTSKAVSTLVKLLDVDNNALQRNVANDILNYVARYKEIQELEERIEAIERSK
ncbi:MAG TPA: hypothetical protein VGZ69_07135 [Candidatus Rhabdochlamydia sp.]|jgi:hypothetical protein|nr:hypothetical protein [Candidatus Rhabdochlamydia sp.]